MPLVTITETLDSSRYFAPRWRRIFVSSHLTGETKCVHTREPQTVVVNRMCVERGCWLQPRLAGTSVFSFTETLSPQEALQGL